MAGNDFEAMMMKDKGYDPASVEGVDDLPYEIPNLAVESHQAQVGVPCNSIWTFAHWIRY